MKIGKVSYIQESEQAQDIKLNETSGTRGQSSQLQSPVQLGSQTNLERQVKRSDLLPLTSAVGHQLPVSNLTRPGE
jgi:hypothetical protein